MSALPCTVVGLNKAGTRMIHLELVAQDRQDALRLARQIRPDAGLLSVRINPQAVRVLEQLATITKPGDLTT